MSDLLQTLNSPNEIQSLTVAKLNELADECRQRIIDVVSRTGGHLASSLGAIELTVALAKVFDFKKDKIVWDVGHQAYTYKLLTERNALFEQLGKKDGISKFLSRSESEYDHFGAGHASTSISAALGISTGSNLNKDSFKSIAVVGDGALTGGLAFEALNHAGHIDQNLIVVFNDNEMSIDPNVGALSKTIQSLSASKSFNLIRKEIIQQLREGPIPKPIRRTLKRLNESFMAFFTQGVWFEKLNFRYFGPIDGHNIKDMVTVLKLVKNVEGPVLLHVLTQKGKGYSHAETDSLSYHGVGAFELESGAPVKKDQSGESYTSIWSRSFLQMMKNDSQVVGISAAMLANTGLAPVKKEFPERIFDVGIAEGHAVTFAGGLATQGIKPFVVIYSTFLQRAFDHISHDVALQNLPVRFILDRAGFVGADGATHHGMMDIGYLRMIPNMVVMAPKDGNEFEEMIQFTYQYDQGPIALRFPRGTTTVSNQQKQSSGKIKLGKGKLEKSGNDILLIAIGSMVETANLVAQVLEDKGLSVGIINARFVKPLDEELILNEAKKVRCIATIEENALAGGFGSGILELLQEHCITKATLRFGVPDQFIEHATREEQLIESGLDSKSICEKILGLWEKLEPRSVETSNNNVSLMNDWRSSCA